MIGDILFYRNKTNIPDYLIALWEGYDKDKGPFIHCAIDLGDNTKIEALMRGISRSLINDSLVDARYCTEHVNSNAVDFLFKQLGQPYGYGDILDVVLQHSIFTEHYDCSDLAAQFLALCSDKHSIRFETPNDHMITPEQLANILGIQ